jgi:RNA polymerase sigma-70 factor (ECF subfamily)
MQALGEKLSALERMWESHRDAVRRLLIGLGRDLDLADDLLQETYLRAREGISGYRGGDGRAWLSAIARNVFHSHLRQRYVASETPLDSAQEMTGDRVPTYDRHDLLAIRQALAALRPALRSALIMKHYAGYTYQEIARHQQCPVGTAKWRVSEALGRLRLVLLPERRTAMAGSAEAHGIGLADYAYGVLPEDEAAKVRAHLAECSACKKQADGLKRVVSLLDALEGDRKQMHFVELDEEGRVTLYSSSTHLNASGRTLTTSEFGSGGAPDHVYQEGEEVAFTSVRKPERGEVERFAATLHKPVQPGERLSELLVYLPKPGWGAERVGDGRFRLFWKQGPGSTQEFAYVQAIRLPAEAELLSADPKPDETRGDGRVTLVWRRVLPPAAFFECTVAYRLKDCG